MFCSGGVSNFGALLGGAGLSVSGTPKEMMSTMLETSFLMRSGRTSGNSFFVNRRLQRYIARANSGKKRDPDLVVSDSTLTDVS